MSEKSRTTTEDRLKKIEQKRVKLAEEAAKLRVALRKKDNNVKLKLGGLVWKAGLKDEADNVILGILVSGFQNLEKHRSTFEDLGRKKFDADSKAKQEEAAAGKPLVPVYKVRFVNGPPSPEIRDSLKGLGFRWDADNSFWWVQAALSEQQIATLKALPGASVEGA